MSDWMDELKEFMDMASKISTPLDTPEVKEAKLQAFAHSDVNQERLIKFATQLQDIFENGDEQ